MTWSRREFIKSAVRALTVALTASMVPTSAFPFWPTSGPLAHPVIGTLPRHRRFKIQARVDYRQDRGIMAWQVSWSFEWQGRQYDFAQLYDAIITTDRRGLERELVRCSAPSFEAAMRRRLEQVAA